MSEQRLRELFAAESVDEVLGPSRVDIPGVIHRERRRRRWRAAAVSVVTLMAVVATVGVATLARPGPIGVPVGPPASEPVTAAPGPSNPARPESCPPGAPTAAPKGPRASCVLRNAVRNLVPGASLSVHPAAGLPHTRHSSQPLQLVPWRNETPGHAMTEAEADTPAPDDGATDATFLADAIISSSGHGGRLSIGIGSFTPDDRDFLLAQCRDSSMPSLTCAVVTDPANRPAIARSFRNDGATTMYDVVVFAGHTEVAASISSDTSLPGLAATGWVPPIDTDVLLHLAASPELAIFG